MTTPPMSGSSPAPATTRVHERQLATQSSVCASVAIVLGLVWGPVMWAIAFVLRPPQPGSSGYNPFGIATLQHDAALAMWIILITSFLLVLALMILGIVLGRRALRFANGEQMAARLDKWGGVSLVISLLSVGGLLLEYFAPGIFQPFAFIPYIVIQLSVVLFIALAAMGAMSGFILSGMAARATVRTRVSLAESALMVLSWFLFVALLAQFIIKSYSHLVF
ncbi:MAG TPA: hypothetical protein VFS83_18035 [Ktedonobacterales bacterium]|nr:hypothetical protein [Ktedonobacterales bacterium]